MATLFWVLPGSFVAPWVWLYSDRVYAQLYGPTLTQTMRSPVLRDLLSQIPPRSRVLTDNPNWLVAFRDVYVVNSVQGETRQGRFINKMVAPVFELESSQAEVLRRLRALPYPPEYVLLSPRVSNLSWMKYDHAVPFKKLAEVTAPETTYFTNTFVLYRVDLSSPPQVKTTSVVTLPPAACKVRRIFPAYRSFPPPQGWSPKGDELYDGRWDHPQNALLWVPLKLAWFYIKFGPTDDETFVQEVIV